MNQYAYDPYMPVQQSNTLGLAGFICSLVGLLTGGLLSPVGLIISLVAMGKQPRGFATAGLILGILGTCGGVIVVLIFGAAIFVAVLAALGIAVLALALSETEKVEITSDMIKIAAAVEQYKEKNDYLPASLQLLALEESTLRDPWGEQYRYVQNDPKEDFDLVSAGEDKSFDTADDVRLSEIDKVWAFSKGVKISKRNGGIVRIDFGDNKIAVDGDDDGGKVTVTAGGKTIEVTGTENEGNVNIGDAPAAPQPPTSLEEPSAPPATPEEPG